jgi:hypothetical protein
VARETAIASERLWNNIGIYVTVSQRNNGTTSADKHTILNEQDDTTAARERFGKHVPTSNTSFHLLRCDSRRGFGLDIAFSHHFHTRLVTTLNCSAIDNFHNLQIIIAHAKSFRARSVFTSNWLVTASNNVYFSASGLKSSLNGGSLPTANSCSN